MSGTEPAELILDGEADRLTINQHPAEVCQGDSLSIWCPRVLLGRLRLDEGDAQLEDAFEEDRVRWVVLEATGHDRLHEVVLEAMLLHCFAAGSR